MNHNFLFRAAFLLLSGVKQLEILVLCLLNMKMKCFVVFEVDDGGAAGKATTSQKASPTFLSNLLQISLHGKISLDMARSMSQ